MQSWIVDQAVFEGLHARARACVDIDSGLIPSNLTKLVFDDAELCTRYFAELLQKLLLWSGESHCHYIVLDPDPVSYFRRSFGAYPVVNIELGDSSTSYLARLSEGPAGNPADAAGTNWTECVITSSSRDWFVHANRTVEDNGGHLWVLESWIGRILKMYPYAHIPDG